MKSKINHNSLKNYLVVFFGITLAVQSILAASGLFPKMSAATNIYVVDCQQDSEEARMTAWALQGLVNQSFAEVYVTEKEKERHMEQLKDCGKPFEMLEPLAGNNSGLRTLKKYQGRVKRGSVLIWNFCQFVSAPDRIGRRLVFSRPARR